MEVGFKAVKLRMHRPNPWDDLATVVAVREAVGDGITILVDANQNHKAKGYETWSLGTSLKIAEELELVPTAGSDFHGRIKSHIQFGCIEEGEYWMVVELRKRKR